MTGIVELVLKGERIILFDPTKLKLEFSGSNGDWELKHVRIALNRKSVVNLGNNLSEQKTAGTKRDDFLVHRIQ